MNHHKLKITLINTPSTTRFYCFNNGGVLNLELEQEPNIPGAYFKNLEIHELDMLKDIVNYEIEMRNKKKLIKK